MDYNRACWFKFKLFTTFGVMKKLTGTFLLLWISVIALAQVPIQNIPLITVEGESYLRIKPDYVILGFKVSKEMQVTSQGMPTVFEIFRTQDTKIKLFDFDDKNISETLIQIEKPVYVKEIFISIYDLTLLDRIISELYKLGYKDFHYIDYRIKNITDLQYQAKLKAIAAAKIKASLLAKELGQTIGKAHFIEELDYPDYNWYNIHNDVSIKELTYKQDADDYVIEPGFITISAKIRVSFDLIK